MLRLNSQKRTVFGKKMAPARADGDLPAVLYGLKHPTEAVFVKTKDFKKILREAGETSVIELTEPKVNVMVHEVQRDPASGEPIHVDFYAVEMDKPVTAAVPLVFVGAAPAVKELGGVLVKVMHEVEVEALPDALPHALSVQLSALKSFEDRIRAVALDLPAGVNLKIDPEEIIALVEAPREEAVEPTLSLEDIEVEKKGKKEEELADSEETL